MNRWRAMKLSEIYDPVIVVAAILFIGFVMGRLSRDRDRPPDER